VCVHNACMCAWRGREKGGGERKQKKCYKYGWKNLNAEKLKHIEKTKIRRKEVNAKCIMHAHTTVHLPPSPAKMVSPLLSFFWLAARFSTTTWLSGKW
jgi:hypothetical protein